MTHYLLDTCIMSEYIKKKPNRKVIEWLNNLNENNLFISILTLGELKKGITKLKSSNLNRYNKLSFWIKTIEERFSQRILILDNDIINIWADICRNSESQGITLPIIDSLIMATAKHHNLTIVTRNTVDFTCYSKIINPWEL